MNPSTKSYNQGWIICALNEYLQSNQTWWGPLFPPHLTTNTWGYRTEWSVVVEFSVWVNQIYFSTCEWEAALDSGQIITWKREADLQITTTEHMFKVAAVWISLTARSNLASDTSAGGRYWWKNVDAFGSFCCIWHTSGVLPLGPEKHKQLQHLFCWNPFRRKEWEQHSGGGAKPWKKWPPLSYDASVKPQEPGGF